VKREQITARLAKLREGRLLQEVGDLKKRWNHLELIEQTRINAVTVTREATSLSVRDLGLFGEIRLGCIRLGNEVTKQIKHRSERVILAQKLAERARIAHAGIVRDRLAAEERLLERDAEQFHSWERSRG
jgi:hypothetical protein